MRDNVNICFKSTRREEYVENELAPSMMKKRIYNLKEDKSKIPLRDFDNEDDNDEF